MDRLITRLGLALAIGLLVGLERGWRERNEPAGSRTAGIRTYGLSGLLGGISAALAKALASELVLVASFLGFLGVFAWFKVREAAHDEDFSVTGVVAGLSVFLLGALAVTGEVQAAAAGGAALAAVLASREVLHGLLKSLSWVEVRSALVLAVMTAIVLPLLPNRTIDPWGGLNLWEIWFFTVLTAAISYLGYIAVRLFGTTRGLIVSALAGAVVSSTAVTLALGQAAKRGGDAIPMAGAASLAAMVSVLRVGAVVTIVRPQVVGVLAPAVLAAALAFGLCGVLLLLRKGDSEPLAPPEHSPFDLAPLLLFAAMFGVIATLDAAATTHLGPSALLVASAISGTVDVDAATLSALRLSGTAATVETVGQAILAAVVMNAILRVAIAAISGPARYSVPFLGATATAVVFGAVVFVLVPGR
jgi:uncharacterized membrane protein (DUF4010 family)